MNNIKTCNEKCFLKQECTFFNDGGECKVDTDFNQWLQGKTDIEGVREILLYKTHNDANRYNRGVLFERHQGDIIDEATNNVGQQLIEDIELLLKFEGTNKKQEEIPLDPRKRKK